MRGADRAGRIAHPRSGAQATWHARRLRMTGMRRRFVQPRGVKIPHGKQPAGEEYDFLRRITISMNGRWLPGWNDGAQGCRAPRWSGNPGWTLFHAQSPHRKAA